MHRMTQRKPARILGAMALGVCLCMVSQLTSAGPPSVIHADFDYSASGYVTPAGMVPPSMYHPGPGGVMPVGYQGMSPHGQPGMSPLAQQGLPPLGMQVPSALGYQGVMPAGYQMAAGCDSGMCDSMYGDSGCDGCCGGGMSCGGCAGCLGEGGVLGKLSGPSSGGMSNLRHICPFCGGSGCSACQMFGRGYLLSAFCMLRPHGEGGLCSQRWYDLSLEAIFLGHHSGVGGDALTTLGVAPGVAGDPVPANQVVLSLNDADGGGELDAGIRLSLAMIWGPGGNMEFTYIGGQEWSSQASVSDTNPVFFSVISDFGRNPINGFDDTDRSTSQSITAESEFHSAELNYRRRTVGPYCRFQGSWLVGLRYPAIRRLPGVQHSRPLRSRILQLPGPFEEQHLRRPGGLRSVVERDSWRELGDGHEDGLGTERRQASHATRRQLGRSRLV